MLRIYWKGLVIYKYSVSQKQVGNRILRAMLRDTKSFKSGQKK